MTKLCFGDGDVFVHLYIILYWTIFTIYNELAPVVSVKNVTGSKNLQILWKLFKIDYKGQ